MSATLPALEAPSTPAGAPRSLPGLLVQRSRETPNRVALRRNEEGRWREYTWSEYEASAARAGMGLQQLGVKPGDRIAIHSENRPQWLFADLGAQGIGAVSVGVYPTSPATELAYLLDHSEAVVLIAEDEEQLDKALAVREHMPHLRWIVVIETGLVRQHLEDNMIISYEELDRLGGTQPIAQWRERVALLDPADVAITVYTSGTTGPPKGAMLSHRNLLAVAEAADHLFEQYDGHEVLSYLPLCHIAERVNSEIDALYFRVVVNFGQGSDSFAADMRDVQPTAFLGVPRVWEKLLAAVQTRIADATWAKRTTYALWLSQGRRIARKRMTGRMNPLDWALYSLGWLMLYRSLRDKLGLRRVRLALSGAAPIAPEVLEWFWAIGVPVREAYGQTENTAIATYTPADKVKIGRVGVAYPGVEIRIADDGEILTRGPGTFVGYHKNPEATAETIDADGWLHTGDVGELDDDGFLKITDRKKDLIITAGGKNISPSEIENMLKVSPYVREAVVIGDRRKYLTALIGIELDTVGDWATRRFMPYTTYEDLSHKPEVRQLVSEWVDHVNRNLAQVEQIKDFRLMAHELAHEDGQLTATMKVKRKAVAEQFADLIEEMYR
ncbi:MAG TPA: long-chain fatty acid--CoA ligase [Acidimicrobiales bacterium]